MKSFKIHRFQKRRAILCEVRIKKKSGVTPRMVKFMSNLHYFCVPNISLAQIYPLSLTLQGVPIQKLYYHKNLPKYKTMELHQVFEWESDPLNALHFSPISCIRNAKVGTIVPSLVQSSFEKYSGTPMAYLV